ncbi:PREDICTED: zinc finger protein ZAT4 isoform X1 [Tarenaya hassleriana]|uniref:zinc finger protein ZAT4 isoform X1 n=1 Tax=Tarenaya hassleriana TaxID=28532 RepID=UPI00053C59AD|nr:PREDICTED: zinc finger protein ZAT4 isoform X1 [Tarenaya hassleriana]XP_010524400.1 PREDICTED: zinc finger protein ZAT4 isoform X2 [Tarenaya hassleriana]XP_010524401.1 PREDICTED: zinc finger protein ZAT4 isoform X1 [Tarenaya hassleriana]XP_010524402.1 PREDICTED: zinc finger protein ZAT4 isoform X1 [Tarenaya hassleriana]
MERYKCRFCFKSFVNGRALGGHMRSHMLSLSARRERFDVDEDERPSPLSDESESGGLFPSSSASSSSASSDDDDDDDGHVGEFYGLRENRKRSTLVADPDFAFPVVDHGSVLLQDGESETESSRINPTRRRSKRTRKLGGLDVDHSRGQDNVKKPRTSQLGFRTEPEHLSSASDTTTEEDLAFCLMMLSRDKWKQKSKSREVQDQDNNDHGEEENDMDESQGYRESKNRARGKYKCDTCDKVFKSYQALGGHRASHKKNRVCRTEHPRRATEYEVGNAVAEKKIHECPICLRVFPSGQALGGHKRSHGIVSSNQNHVLRVDKDASLTNRRFIDLNLPAPTEDDETSQAEVSVVFDEC